MPLASSSPPRILIVEDHRITRRFLADNLEADGYMPLEAESMAAARGVIAGAEPALAVLDLGLPDGDGLELLAALRDGDGGPGADLPVLVLSGRASEFDRIRGLERGADGYLVKPYSYLELRAHVAALLRRSGRPAPVLRVATLEIDVDAREVQVEGERVTLSNKEFELARMLASAPTRTFTRHELLREVWGYRSPGRTRTLDSHAYRLRRRLGIGSVRYVINVWGVGYKLLDAEARP